MDNNIKDTSNYSETPMKFDSCEMKVDEVENAAKIFTPVLNDKDDFLTFTIKHTILMHNINLDHYAHKFGINTSQFNNMKTMLNSQTRMSTRIFGIWCTVLDIYWDLNSKMKPLYDGFEQSMNIDSVKFNQPIVPVSIINTPSQKSNKIIGKAIVRGCGDTDIPNDILGQKYYVKLYTNEFNDDALCVGKHCRGGRLELRHYIVLPDSRIVLCSKRYNTALACEMKKVPADYYKHQHEYLIIDKPLNYEGVINLDISDIERDKVVMIKYFK